ncbi:PaaI family thioesterase [Streptomyces sp. LN704]|uniref:PaaI family thioesterase n=1 Tax=Streptomyces sp. LN704 TaxID=3112982 RepID=UPI00371CB0EA
MAHLGARMTRITQGRVHIVLPSRPEVTQQHGYFHAGATSAIADSAGGYAAFTHPDRVDGDHHGTGGALPARSAERLTSPEATPSRHHRRPQGYLRAKPTPREEARTP